MAAKITLRGGVAVACALLAAVFHFAFIEIWAVAALFAVKHAFGEAVFRRVLPLANLHHNLLQRFYLCWVDGVLEHVLGTRVAYTVVDGEGQQHLEQHYTTEGHTETGAVERHIDLDKALRPPSKSGKAKIILMNHHCRVDWLYMFIFLAHTRSIVSHVRFVLKGDLKQLPVLGWCMEIFRYLFLSRSWESDEVYIRRMIDLYNATSDTPVILIFPEGTDLSPSNIERSQAFAAKTGLPKFHHVLNPRTTGTVAIMDMLGGVATVEEVIDLTIAYTYHGPGERPNEPSLVNGHHPKKVHLLINAYPVAGSPAASALQNAKHVCPTDAAALTAWIHDRFAEKEQLLSRFLVTNPIGFDPADVRAVLGKEVGVASFDEDEARLRHPNESRLKRHYEHVGFFGAVITPLYWVAPPLLCILYTRWWLSGLWVVAILFGFMKLSKAMGGVQRPLYLDEVAADKTLVERLRRRLMGSQKKTTKRG